MLMEHETRLQRFTRTLVTIFGSNVRDLRKERGWSQEELSRQLAAHGFSMHQTTIAKVEAGTRPTTVRDIGALASVFHVNVNELLGHNAVGASDARKQEVLLAETSGRLTEIDALKRFVDRRDKELNEQLGGQPGSQTEGAGGDQHQA
jgi:transcriptional regulator with XRE-family HTH domain